MSNKRAVEKVLHWAAKRFPVSKVTAETISAYAEELEVMDSARLELAFKTLIGKNEFWPSIKAIQDAERHLVLGDSEAAVFRKTELELIQLNDERRGGVITLDQYRARRAKVLETTGITEEMLENATVSGVPGSRTWGELRWQRRARLGNEEGT